MPRLSCCGRLSVTRVVPSRLHLPRCRCWIRRRGLTATVHGFRSSFSTWAAEETDFPEEVREACLAHFSGNKTAAAYQRGDLRSGLDEPGVAHAQRVKPDRILRVVFPPSIVGNIL